MKPNPSVELFLSRFADGEWRETVRPWLEARTGMLDRSLVVAPTRGHAQALKQRCLCEGVALLGVEFLTPGLARRKRLGTAGIGRPLQLLVLRARIAARIAPLAADDPARGLWRSLESDLESALSDFEELLRGGFRAEHFPRPELRELFGEMQGWMEARGYGLGPLQDEIAGLTPVRPDEPPVAGRLLILAGGPEGWGDFFGLVALARRCPSVRVIIAEPEFMGRGGFGEEWVEAWQSVLDVEAKVVGADPDENCSGVAELWEGGGGSPERADVLIAHTKSQEMERVAEEVVRLLAQGSENVGVVFPKAGAAHARLVRLLDGRGVRYADLIGTAGTPSVDTRIQRSLVDFYERGCRLEELLFLWPLLRSLSLVSLTPAEARGACQRLFDEVQSHYLEPHVGLLESSDDKGWREVGRVARLLMPCFPEQLSAADALDRFEAARDRLGLAEPAGWPALREFARRADEPMPSKALLQAIRAFLPEMGPAEGSSGKSAFARVTLTTLQRAAGTAWSDVILAEANRGVWPQRREASCWLCDEARRELNMKAGRFPLGLPTADDRALHERRLYCAVARNTRRRVLFSAALFSDDEPEVGLGPNAWLERVLWSKGLLSPTDAGSEAFGRLASGQPREGPEAGAVPPPGEWARIWNRRRDPSAPFDEFFLGDPRGARRPSSLSALQIERGASDPATLWFDAVLAVRRVDWRPFTRARRKSVGNAVHRVLAAALRGAPVEGRFFRLPERSAAQLRLQEELSRLRARWPADRYWDSFHMDVSRASRELLERVFELPASDYCAVELRLPDGASVPVGEAGRMRVRGRVDLLLADRTEWNGASVVIVDFKTGGDSRLSTRRMASSGASLQLGVYLEAARSVGAAGSVWMLKPEERPTRIGTEDLDKACAKLRILGAHLETGIYGARTADRGEYTHGFEWPLACAPIPSAILESKFALTFGGGDLPEEEEGADE